MHKYEKKRNALTVIFCNVFNPKPHLHEVLKTSVFSHTSLVQAGLFLSNFTYFAPVYRHRGAPKAALKSPWQPAHNRLIHIIKRQQAAGFVSNTQKHVT